MLNNFLKNKSFGYFKKVVILCLIIGWVFSDWMKLPLPFNFFSDYRGGLETVLAGPNPPPPINNPGTPGTPTFANVTSTALTVNWTSGSDTSYYKIERCSGSSCSDFSQIATTTSLSYDDLNLNPSTLYRYRIKGTNTQLVDGPYSEIGEETTIAVETIEPPSRKLRLFQGFKLRILNGKFKIW